jgi:hypothetical protein
MDSIILWDTWLFEDINRILAIRSQRPIWHDIWSLYNTARLKRRFSLDNRDVCIVLCRYLLSIYEELFSHNSIFIVDPMPNIYSDTPVRITLCWEYYYDNNYDDYWTNNCDEIYIYARMCHGKLQFDLSYFSEWGCGDCLCLGRVKTIACYT